MPFFDAIAGQYDATFTDTPLGAAKRAEVHRVLERTIRAGMRVLELNCGTGRDALYMAQRGANVVATDISDAMLHVARSAAQVRGMESHIDFRRLDLHDLADREALNRLGTFDLVFSNFDGLNCMADPGIALRALPNLLNEGGTALLVYMPPVCAMEIVLNLARLQPRKAFGRLTRKGIDVHIGNAVVMRTYFHAVERLVRALPIDIQLRGVRSIGLFLPPTWARGLYERVPRFFNILERLTSPLRSFPPFNRMGDHVLLSLQRKGISQ